MKKKILMLVFMLLLPIIVFAENEDINYDNTDTNVPRLVCMYGKIGGITAGPNKHIEANGNALSYIQDEAEIVIKTHNSTSGTPSLQESGWSVKSSKPSVQFSNVAKEKYASGLNGNYLKMCPQFVIYDESNNKLTFTEDENSCINNSRCKIKYEPKNPVSGNREPEKYNSTYKTEDGTLDPNTPHDKYALPPIDSTKDYINNDKTCNGVLGETMTKVVNNIFTTVQFLGPVLVIVMSIIDFSKAAISGEAEDMKKAQGKLIKRIICAILLFFVPLLCKLLFSITGVTVPDTCIK